jgi:hypothetical protein
MENTILSFVKWYSLFIDFSEESTAFIFKVEREDGGSSLPRNARKHLLECKAHIPEESIIHSHTCDDLNYLMELIDLCFEHYRQVRVEVCRGDGAESAFYIPKPPI